MTTFPVNGVVVDRDGKPVAGALVRALSPANDNQIAQSDSQGRFQLGVNRAAVDGLSFVARTADGRQQAFSRFAGGVAPGMPLPSLRLTMRPARSIEIVVLDREGKPVPDAVVGVVAEYMGLDRGRTDPQGKVTLRVPVEAPLKNIYALKSGVGLDYLSLPDAERATTGDLPQPLDLSRPQFLKLDGARTVKIKLIDPEGRPIQGVRVAPWYFHKPKWEGSDDLNISSVEDFQTKSDSAGVAVFDWIPFWDKEPTWFWPSDRDRWTGDRITVNLSQVFSETTVQLQRRVPVRGEVRHSDGRPAAGVLIQADGDGRPVNHFRGRVVTDEQGRYEIRVDPDKVYLVAVIDPRWGAAARGGIAVRRDEPVEGIDFQLLASATRLHGQVTLGPEKKPWANRTVTLLVEGPGWSPSIPRWATTDAEGKYAFTIGPGKYTIWSDDAGFEQKLTVTDQKDLVYDFHARRSPRGMITVRVMDRGNPPRPVPHAHVVGVSISSMTHGNLEATTNSDGWFRVERWLDKMIVYGFSKDKKLAGIVNIGPDDAEAALSLQPVGAAKGQLIDQSNGQPAGNRVIRCETFYHYEQQPGVGSSYLVETGTADAEGQFKIADLMPGVEYTVQVEMSKETDPAKIQDYDRIGKVTVKGGETLDLGQVKFRRDFAQGELLDVMLGDREPLDKRLKGMAEDANKPGKRVLVMFWTDESREHMNDIFTKDFYGRFSNNGILVSPADQKQMDHAKAAYGKKWGLDPSVKAWPLFGILDVDGRTLAVKETHDFVKNGKVDQSLVTEFLKKYALKAPDDKKTLDATTTAVSRE